VVAHFSTATSGLQRHFTGTLSLRRLQFQRNIAKTLPEEVAQPLRSWSTSMHPFSAP